MITDAVVALLVSVLKAVFSALPTGNLSAVFTPMDTGLHSLGAYMNGWDTWLPLTETVNLLSITVSTILPAVIVYKICNWTWRHIPDLWGFGPGAG